MPLIAVCDEGTELAEAIRQYECGTVVPPGSPEKIVEVLEDLDADKSLLLHWKAGAHAAMQEFRRNTNTRRFAEVLCNNLGLSLNDGVADAPKNGEKTI